MKKIFNYNSHKAAKKLLSQQFYEQRTLNVFLCDLRERNFRKCFPVDFRAFVGCILVMIIIGCSAEKAEIAGEPVRIVLDWTPNTNHTGIYVALDKGWFADEGLAVSILLPPEDGALLLLASGKAEFAVEAQENLGPAIANSSLPITAVAAVINHNTSGLMSLSSAGIKRPKDLEGKRFASWETPLVRALIREIVEHDGGKFDEVKMIPNMAVDVFSALRTDVDCVWIYYAWDGIAAEIRGIPIDYLDLRTISPILDFYTPVIIINDAWAAANPETAKKFMKVLSLGYEYCIYNPGKAAEILLKHAPELDGELVRQSQVWLASRYRGNAGRWGEVVPGRWGAFYRWMFRQGLLDRDLDEEGFTNEYLP